MTVENPRQKEPLFKISDSLVLQLPRFVTELIARKGYCRTPEEIIKYNEEIVKDNLKRTEVRYFAAQKALGEGELTIEKLDELHAALDAHLDARVGHP